MAQDWAEIIILKISLSEQFVNIWTRNGSRLGRDCNIKKSVSEQVVNIWTPIGSRLGRDYNIENVSK